MGGNLRCGDALRAGRNIPHSASQERSLSIYFEEPQSLRCATKRSGHIGLNTFIETTQDPSNRGFSRSNRSSTPTKPNNQKHRHVVTVAPFRTLADQSGLTGSTAGLSERRRSQLRVQNEDIARFEGRSIVFPTGPFSAPKGCSFKLGLRSKKCAFMPPNSAASPFELY